MIDYHIVFGNSKYQLKLTVNILHINFYVDSLSLISVIYAFGKSQMIDYHIVFVKKKKHFFNVLHYNFIHFFLLIRKISTCNSKSEFIFYKLNLSEITPFKRNTE